MLVNDSLVMSEPTPQTNNVWPLTSSPMENKDAEEFFNNPDDHILGSNSNPEREENGSLPDVFDAQLSQEWLNLDQPAPAQSRGEALRDFRNKRKNAISTMIRNIIPLNEARISDTVNKFCMIFGVFTASMLGVHIDFDHVKRLIDITKEKELMNQAEENVKIQDPHLGGLTFKRPGPGNWSKAYENALSMYVDCQNKFEKFMNDRKTIIAEETSRGTGIHERINGIQREIDVVYGKLVGMDAQMFEPDCLSYSNEMRKQQIMENTKAITRVILNLDCQDSIETLINRIRDFVASKVEHNGLMVDELKEKQMKESRIRECISRNFDNYFCCE